MNPEPMFFSTKHTSSAAHLLPPLVSNSKTDAQIHDCVTQVLFFFFPFFLLDIFLFAI
jgi:hypothetical protein